MADGVSSRPAAGRGARIAAIDVAKGVAILAMIAYHFSWDLSAYRLIAVDVGNDPGWRIFARSIAGSFLFLVGVNLVLATRNGIRPKPFVRRLALILGGALLVSAGTWWLDPRTFVHFGILHAIFVSSILAIPLLRAPLWVIVPLAVAFLAGPHVLASPVFDRPFLYWLGLSTSPPASVDYVPLFPWFGVVLFGVAGGRLILADPGLALWRWPAAGRAGRFLAAAGRWSLLIYVLHQPILIGGIMLVAPMLGPGPEELRTQVFREFETSCAAVGYDRDPCQAYAACILGELDRHENILADAARRELSDEDHARWLGYIEACRAKTLPAPSPGGAI